MKQINIRRAQPIGDQEIEELVISFSIEVPPVRELGEASAIFLADAEALCEALYSVLPGGTFDRLTSLMLAKKVTHFIVSHTR